jgi:hypothetical protein
MGANSTSLRKGLLYTLRVLRGRGVNFADMVLRPQIARDAFQSAMDGGKKEEIPSSASIGPVDSLLRLFDVLKAQVGAVRKRYETQHSLDHHQRQESYTSDFLTANLLLDAQQLQLGCPSC